MPAPWATVRCPAGCAASTAASTSRSSRRTTSTPPTSPRRAADCRRWCSRSSARSWTSPTTSRTRSTTSTTSTAPACSARAPWRASSGAGSRGRASSASLDDEALARRSAPPGSALEALRRKLHRSDAWVAADDAFAEAVDVVADDLVDGLLAIPFDGSIASERALSSFTNRWISHLQTSVVPAPADEARTGPVTLDRLAWHEVEVLKFVHRHFILDRADVVMYQRGLSRVLTRAVKGLTAWVTDELDRDRVPQRLKELVELAPTATRGSARRRPEGVPIPDAGEVLRLGVGRGVDRLRRLALRRPGPRGLGGDRRPARPALGHRAEPLTSRIRRPQAGDPLPRRAAPDERSECHHESRRPRRAPRPRSPPTTPCRRGCRGRR